MFRQNKNILKVTQNCHHWTTKKREVIENGLRKQDKERRATFVKWVSPLMWVPQISAFSYVKVRPMVTFKQWLESERKQWLERENNLVEKLRRKVKQQDQEVSKRCFFENFGSLWLIYVHIYALIWWIRYQSPKNLLYKLKVTFGFS